LVSHRIEPCWRGAGRGSRRGWMQGWGKRLISRALYKGNSTLSNKSKTSGKYAGGDVQDRE
jgi:hypothetical protein